MVIFEGGTADITVQKISSTGILHNLHKASGGPWGGNNINKAFMELLVKLFGEFTIQEICNGNMDDFFELSLNIEIAKRKISSLGDSTITINIPPSLCEIHKKNMSTLRAGMSKQRDT